MIDYNSRQKKWWEKKENYWILGGFLIAVTALSMPFLIMYCSNQKFNLNAFQTLGVVGDFFGGTTVGLLSLASIIFVTAAIIMQKEELELQREEVRATRKEYEITNSTMKKQQFESTFFNMINLQQSILKEIKIEDKYGRDAIKLLHEYLVLYYENQVFRDKVVLVYEKLSQVDNEILKEFSYNLFLAETEREFLHYVNYRTLRLSGESEEEEKQRYLKVKEERLHKALEEAKADFNKKYLDNRIEQENYVCSRKIEHLIKIPNCPEIFIDFYKDFYEYPIYDYKKETYELVYKENENVIGHYYRNLYRSIKIIQETVFDETSEKNNEKEKKKYRGILRAQLSSFELLMVFYNMVYSEKGEKFKQLIIGTNFFDDHIVEKDFIWRSDKAELENLK
ncbi:putative phage abortive infection protein [Niallia taxi]|uniref:putative phage abortive infection protein n=1 Tax=Niallia taxi TaxID=2499688 RepID=UPI0015F357D6|nr:putative phage abortive infection protein [Niallia taxi]